jgi:hypothetical protein
MVISSTRRCPHLPVRHLDSVIEVLSSINKNLTRKLEDLDESPSPFCILEQSGSFLNNRRLGAVARRKRQESAKLRLLVQIRPVPLIYRNLAVYINQGIQKRRMKNEKK